MAPDNYYDVFVSKFNPQGSGFVYSTFLGGSLIEFAGGIAVDGSYNAFVTGETTSTDFPVVSRGQRSLHPMATPARRRSSQG